MAIPDYQTLMLPVLKSGAAGEVSVRDAIDRLAREFNLTEAERAELLPSGKQAIFTNRVQWATTYLVKAGLLQARRLIVPSNTTRMTVVPDGRGLEGPRIPPVVRRRPGVAGASLYIC